jgi:hypothetical protein
VFLPTQVAAAVAADMANTATAGCNSSFLPQQLTRCLSSMAAMQLQELEARGNR